MSNTKTFFALLAALLLSSVSLSAKPRTFSEAQTIAKRYASYLGVTLSSASMEAAKSLNAPSPAGRPLAYYVFPNAEGQGFTIVSGDDRMPEIVGYSTQGTYDANHLPDGYKTFLELYSGMVAAVCQGDSAASATLSESFRFRVSSVSRAKVSPLLGGRVWNQSAPFNDLCPMDGAKRSFTGCAATALAQVMAYWKHPAALQADIPAYTTRTKRLNVPAIAAGEAYDWDNMIDNYNGKYSQAQGAAVAKLMYHCGAAIQMDYTSSASGGYYTLQRLAKYFGYDLETMVEIAREDYSLEDWMDILDAELAAGRPMLYYGNSSDGAHEFVCDGSDGSGFYHINWGWGGYQDGYFDITLLNPKKGGAGSGSADDGYSQDCRVILGIQPRNSERPVYSLELVSTTSNAEQGLYERENAYYSGHHVEAPKTTAGDAVFTYGIKNNGAPTSFKYYLYVYGYPSGAKKVKNGTLDLAGDGAVTYLSTSILPSDVRGDRSIACSLYTLSDENKYEYLPSMLDEWRVYIVGGDLDGWSYALNPGCGYVYVAGDVPSSVSSVGAAQWQVVGGQGEIVLTTDSSGIVPVYAVDGRKVADVETVAGAAVRVPVSPGLYIVKGRKVVVR